jgi:hypothetical protein
MSRPVFRPSILFWVALWGLGIVIGCGHSQPGDQRDIGSAASEQADLPPVGTEDVLTYHNDNSRTGQYLEEKILAPSNVNSGSFGKLGFLRVDGRVDAEPLFVSNVDISAASHRVVYVVTEHDLAYAFDADDYSPLWRTSLVNPGETTSDPRNCGQVAPEIGVTSTPVIDLKAGPHGTIYIVAMSKDHNGKYFQRLHALDVASGAELPGSPQTISASFPGNGAGSRNGTVTFDPKQYEDRAALLLVNGLIYTTWSSHCDQDPYTGWVIAYNAV